MGGGKILLRDQKKKELTSKTRSEGCEVPSAGELRYGNEKRGIKRDQSEGNG